MAETGTKRGRGRPRGSKNKKDAMTEQSTTAKVEPTVTPSGDKPEFEPMINVETDSQFNSPVSDRESPLQQLPPSSQNGASDNEYFDDSQVHDGGSEEHHDHGGGEGQDSSFEEEGGEKKDIPPQTKKKAIKKTAKMLGRFYQQILPALPKRVAQIPEATLNRMSVNDEIDLGSVYEFGSGSEMTIAEFVQQNNELAEQTLVITDEQRDEWEECVHDVLEEKQAALTPMQRLMIVSGMHVLALTGSAIELRMQMNANMAVFKESHASNKKRTQADDQTTERESPAEGKQQDTQTVDATIVEEEKVDGGDDGTETYTAEEVYVEH